MQGSMAWVHQRRTVSWSILLLSVGRVVEQPLWTQEDHLRGLLLVDPWCYCPDRRAEPGYVCVWQTVHRWGFGILLCLCPSSHDRDGISNPPSGHHVVLQHRLVRWIVVSSLGHVRNAKLR